MGKRFAFLAISDQACLSLSSYVTIALAARLMEVRAFANLTLIWSLLQLSSSVYSAFVCDALILLGSKQNVDESSLLNSCRAWSYAIFLLSSVGICIYAKTSLRDPTVTPLGYITMVLILSTQQTALLYRAHRLLHSEYQRLSASSLAGFIAVSVSLIFIRYHKTYGIEPYLGGILAGLSCQATCLALGGLLPYSVPCKSNLRAVGSFGVRSMPIMMFSWLPQNLILFHLKNLGLANVLRKVRLAQLVFQPSTQASNAVLNFSIPRFARELPSNIKVFSPLYRRVFLSLGLLNLLYGSFCLLVSMIYKGLSTVLVAGYFAVSLTTLIALFFMAHFRLHGRLGTILTGNVFGGLCLWVGYLFVIPNLSAEFAAPILQLLFVVGIIVCCACLLYSGWMDERGDGTSEKISNT